MSMETIFLPLMRAPQGSQDGRPVADRLQTCAPGSTKHRARFEGDLNPSDAAVLDVTPELLTWRVPDLAGFL